jgi:hypothetical protein
MKLWKTTQPDAFKLCRSVNVRGANVKPMKLPPTTNKLEPILVPWPVLRSGDLAQQQLLDTVKRIRLK